LTDSVLGSRSLVPDPARPAVAAAAVVHDENWAGAASSIDFETRP
jgi:hypothetical protein